MVVLFFALAAWWFAGWKPALCILLPALAVESVWWLWQWRKWRKAKAAYNGDIQALAALHKLGEKLSTSALAESAGILNEIQTIIEQHNLAYPEDLWAGVADVRNEIAGQRKGGN